ncbi:MAG: DUF1738 domain-containing protein [Cyanobacteria bacterium]|nr:DUF1738 domain-containing protein [Cyanobacteria bacterium bin.51]
MAASKSRSRKTFDGPTAEEKIVASLIELMEAGSAPWRRPWDGSGGGHHVNLISGHRYRGANPILLTLGMHIRASALPFWCGFAEAKKVGIFPRKGSKAVHILRPQLHSREEPGEAGEVTLRSWASYRPVAVFNAADLEGTALAGLIEARKAAEGEEVKPEPERLEAAEALLGAWPVPVSFGGDRACYLPAIDRIQLPDRASFHSPAAFCATWAHEQIHSTGHESRLNGNGYPDLSGDWRPDVCLDARRLDGNHQGISSSLIAAITLWLILPPATHRVHGDDPALSEVGGIAGEEV